MLIPINSTSFKKSFLDGNGNFEVVTDQNIWQTLVDSNSPFNEDVDKIAELKFALGTSKDFGFGTADALKLKVGLDAETAGEIDLIWEPGDSGLIDEYGLAPYLTGDRLYMAVLFNSALDGGLSGAYPAGPLKTRFGIGAGGHVGYTRLKPYDKTASAKEILKDLFAATRLPHQVDKVDEIPAEGEVIVLEYGGYMNLSAGVTWGFSTTGSRSFEVRDLEAVANYDLKIQAALDFEYKVAGDFSIEVRRGSEPGWARFVIRKKKRNSWGFAADLGIDANYDIEGIPESADEFLKAIFGTNTEKFFDYFEKAQKYSSLDELEKAAGKFSRDYLQKYADKYLGKALSNKNLASVLKEIRDITEIYANVDRRIINLYEENIGKIAPFKKVLGSILKLDSFEELESLTDSKAWDLIKKLSGDRFYDVLVDQTEFDKLLEEVRGVKDFLDDGAMKRVRDVIADLKKDYKLDRLFDQLKKYDTPEKLKDIANAKLQAVVEQLVGETFEKLDDFGKVLEDVQNALNNIETYKNKWYKKITEATSQSLDFNLRYAYSSATEEDKLLDLELKLSVKKARELAGKAASGDFAEIIRSYNSSFVKIHPDTVFTKKIAKSAHLQVNVFGWGFVRSTELIQNLQHAIQTERGGLMHVFTLDTHIKQLKSKSKKKKLLEQMQSNFVLRAVGETFQPKDAGDAAFDRNTSDYVIATLKKLAVSYDLFYEDANTRPEELLAYFSLAKTMGIVSDTGELLRELKQEYPDGFGRVSVKYVVRYDDQTVRNAFTLSGDELREEARKIVREVVAAKFTGMRQKDWLPRVGFAYLAPEVADVYYRKGFTALRKANITVKLPRWFTGADTEIKATLLKEHKQVLITLFNIENRFSKRFVKLDKNVDKAQKKGEAVKVNELADAARDFIGMADDLERFGPENAFFIAFDRLTRLGSADKWKRESAMIIKIKPEGEEEVVKYLMG